jgi:hypothetical protein
MSESMPEYPPNTVFVGNSEVTAEGDVRPLRDFITDENGRPTWLTADDVAAYREMERWLYGTDGMDVRSAE